MLHRQCVGRFTALYREVTLGLGITHGGLCFTDLVGQGVQIFMRVCVRRVSVLKLLGELIDLCGPRLFGLDRCIVLVVLRDLSGGEEGVSFVCVRRLCSRMLARSAAVGFGEVQRKVVRENQQRSKDLPIHYSYPPSCGTSEAAAPARPPFPWTRNEGIQFYLAWP